MQFLPMHPKDQARREAVGVGRLRGAIEVSFEIVLRAGSRWKSCVLRRRRVFRRKAFRREGASSSGCKRLWVSGGFFVDAGLRNPVNRQRKGCGKVVGKRALLVENPAEILSNCGGMPAGMLWEAKSRLCRYLHTIWC